MSQTHVTLNIGLTVILVVLLSMLHAGTCFSAGTQPADAQQPVILDGASCVACMEFDRLTTQVRDGLIGKEIAKAEVQRILPLIRDYYYTHGGKDYGSADWVFPLAGYTPRAIAGGRRHGYEPRGYDWFAGNRHAAHPALDIFIHDRNQDERDDRTGSYVQVLSMTGGIVVAMAPDWQPGSNLRGGKYLWVYDPAADSLLYYAHNRALAVTLGTVVNPGDKIATVGRTGYNAAKKRSPTHLHLSWLKIKNGAPVAEYPYQVLLKSRTH